MPMLLLKRLLILPQPLTPTCGSGSDRLCPVIVEGGHTSPPPISSCAATRLKLFSAQHPTYNTTSQKSLPMMCSEKHHQNKLRIFRVEETRERWAVRARYRALITNLLLESRPFLTRAQCSSLESDIVGFATIRYCATRKCKISL